MGINEMDQVLKRVAAGELAPEEAVHLLDGDSAPDQGIPAWGTPAAGSRRGAGVGTDDEPVTLVRLRVAYRSVDVFADPGVEQVHVVGPHSVHRDGATLVIDGPDLPEPPETRSEERGGRFSFASLPRTVSWARNWREHHLTVRVNPNVAVEFDASGCSLRIFGGEAGTRLRLVASSAKLDRVRGPLDISAFTSSVKGTAGPAGTSRITCESSSVKIALLAGTDVRIRATNRMSKVVLPTRVSKGAVIDPEILETVIGRGRDDLTVDALMSSVVIGGTP